MLLGAACAGVIQHDTERMLASAGFHMRPADTTPLDEDLRSIPPHRLVSRTKDGNVVYMWLDPDRCHCIYVGGSQEYSEYERLRLERELKPPAGAAGGAP
jgi:hypothetical protein